MNGSFNYTASVKHVVSGYGDGDLCARVQAEFVEMPGLRLTLAQAVRLFNIEPDQCQRVLGTLILGGHLTTDGKTFASARMGRGSV